MTINSILSRKFVWVAPLVIFLAQLSSFGAGSTAPSVTLAWNPNSESGLLGYNIYYGTAPRVYSGKVSVGSTKTNATIYNLQPGQTYYFAVTAANTAGEESDYSDEVSYAAPGISNTAPTANGQNLTTPEDTATSITLTGSDAEGNPLTYIVASGPTQGTLSGTGPNLTYTPAPNYNGNDSFTFYVNDGTANSLAAAVVITVTSVNDAPAANGQAVAATEDIAKPITLSGSDADGDALIYSIGSGPQHGSLSGSLPNLTYTPTKDYSGADSFTFTVSDGQATSAPATVSINVAPANDAPIADNKIVAAIEDNPKVITLSGSDIDGNPLTYSVATQPSHGTLTGSAPNLTYTPTANYNGPDSFTFYVNDGTVNSSIATISITVAAVNDAPLADSQAVSALEDTLKAITLSGSDVEGDALSYSIASAPGHGTLSGTAPNLSYLPATNYFGSDSFTFTVSDGKTNSATATVTISIMAINEAPTAVAQSVTTAEDTALPVTLAGTDPDNNPLVYSIVAGPAHGTLSGTAPNVIYTPGENYNGQDSFSFKVNDGKADSAAATVSLSVTAVNDAPVANNQNATTAEDTGKPIVLTGSDVDGDSIVFLLVTSPMHGTLSGTPPNINYLPSANYTGPDSFTFKANDGKADSATASVSMNVTPVNDAPVASAQSISTAEDVAKAILLSAADADENPLIYTVTTPPAHGSLTGTAPNLIYLPATNYNGSDSFAFKANDGTVDSGSALVSITITAVNDAPSANDQAVSTDRNVAKSVTLTGMDPDGDTLSFTVATPPTKGVLSGSAPNLTYTPNYNVTGTDSFTFRASDGTLNSATATISINIAQGPNTVPVASAQSVTTAEDSATSVTLAGTDADDDALTFTIVAGPAHGALSGSAPNLIYTPALNFSGTDSFTFKVNDGTADSAPATVSVSVTPENDAPVALIQSLTTPEDTATAISLAGTDVDGDALQFSVTGGPSHGSLSGNAPNLIYTPATDYHGNDSFTFQASDGITNSAPATISIVITPANDAPIALAQSVTTTEDVAKGLILTGTDVDGDALSFVIATQPIHGTLSGSGANRTYTPAANYSGSDSFTFTVNDGIADSAPATVTIAVSAANDAPIAKVQSITTAEDSAVAIVLTGSDEDGDALNYSITTQPTHGKLTGTAPNVSYTPATNYYGADSFSFQVNDGTTNSAPATVTITVTPVNDSPVAVAQSVYTDEDMAKSVTLSASDADGDVMTYTVVTPPTKGTLSGSGANLTYTPAENVNGSDSFWFKANDGSADSSLAVVSITIAPANDAPVAIGVTATTDKNVAKAITLAGTDVDGDSLTFSVVTQPSKGILSGTSPNLLYTPNHNVTGADSFTFQANDGKENSAAATVSITIAPGPNAAPIAIAQTVSTTEDTGKAITLAGTDADDDTLSFKVVTPPTHGTLSGTAPNLTYNPAENYNGDDTFWFTVNDGSTNSSAAVVSLSIAAVNDAPVASAQAISATAGTPKPILLTATDVEGEPLSFNLASQPLHGTLTGIAPNLTYTATSGYTGPDAFTFRANDGTVNSAEATISITVTPAPNTAPIASAQNLATPEDSAKAITLAGSDTDGDALTYSIDTQPAHGTLSGTAPNIVYTPATNYFGPDNFTFRVHDGTEYSASATIALEVTAVNDAPTVGAMADLFLNNNSPTQLIPLSGISAGPGENQDLVVTASSSNPDLIPAPVVGYTSPATIGTLSLTPAANSTGTAVITVLVSDGQPENGTASTSFTVTVQSVAPALTLDPIADVTVQESAPQQTVDLSGISTSEGTTDTSTSSSLRPWLQNTLDKLNGSQKTTLAVTAISSDTSLIPPPAVNYTSPNDKGTLTFAPVAGASGKATISVTVSDGKNEPFTRSFQITVKEVNNPPTLDAIAGLSIGLNSGQQTVALSGITAGSGESQSLTVKATSSNPGLIPNPEVSYTSPSTGGLITFTPVKDASGSAVITVTVDDGQPENNLVTRSFNVEVSSESTVPAIALTSPTAGSTHTAPATITLAASVSANGHTISRVQFFVGATLVGEDLSAPYAVDWDCETNGNYLLVARALYESGGSVDSPAISITVQDSNLPAPWNTMDIGSVLSPGMVSVDQDMYTVQGAGKLEGTDDSFRFVYQPMTDDGEIWLNVPSLPTGGNGACAGIMIRESLSSASPYIFIGILPDGNLQVRTRTSSGEVAKLKQVPGGKPANWIRLVRKGDLLVSGYAKKPGTWSIGNMDSIKMASGVYVGLVVASGDPGTLSTGVFKAPVVDP